MRVNWLQHVPFEGLGAIHSWALVHGHELVETRLWAGDPLPPVQGFEAMIVMGGPMSVHDEALYPWMLPEQRLIEATVRAQKPLLGICLGAQLIARVLGARVFPNEVKEIGWHPVFLTSEARSLALLADVPRSFVPFHWHGETFDVPHEATGLAFSQACTNQGFVYGTRVLALQFHLEITREGVQALLEDCAGDLTPGAFVQPPSAMIGQDRRFDDARCIVFRVLDRFFGTSEA